MISSAEEFSNEICKLIEHHDRQKSFSDIGTAKIEHLQISLIDTTKGLVMIVEFNRNIIIKQRGCLSERKQYIQVGTSYSDCGRSNVARFSQDIWKLLRNTCKPRVMDCDFIPTT